jgi:flagellar L-ring protein precursor FlgH
MLHNWKSSIATGLLLLAPAYAGDKKKGQESPLDLYLKDALDQPAGPARVSAGSLWSPSSRLTDLGADVRAAQVDDLVTIVVNEQASAVSTGQTKASRTSAAKSQISALAGPKSPGGAAQNLLNLNTAQALDGAATTTRNSALLTTLSARVTHVLPNGYLVLEGTKNVQVNSERQTVTVRGVIRPSDLSPGNAISSNQIAQMEIRINGKGVVNDSIRRPNMLYRILLGLLPF